MKKNRSCLLLGVGVVAIFVFVMVLISGCQTTSNTTTSTTCHGSTTLTPMSTTTTDTDSTTTTSATSTTLCSIAGTIYWTQEASSYGTLYVRLYPSGTLIMSIATVDATATTHEGYSFSELVPGSYTVIGYFYKNRWVSEEVSLVSGDQHGSLVVQLSDTSLLGQDFTLEVY